MSVVRFIGCIHLGHKAIAQYRGFHDEFYHDEKLIENWNSVVTSKKDLTFILGDVTMENSNHYYQLDRLNGRKKVILGNHDRLQDIPELLKYVDGVAGLMKYKTVILSHCPIHPNELFTCEYNLHAHIHENELHEVKVMSKYDDKDSELIKTKHRYINCDAARLGFKPKTLEELRKENIDEWENN